MDAVSIILKRAYRGAKPQMMPPTMAELLRKLQEQEATDKDRLAGDDKAHCERGNPTG